MTIRRWGVAALLILGGVAGIALYKQSLIQQHMDQAYHGEPVMTVDVQRAQPGAFTDTIKVNGQVIAFQRVDVRNELAGKISKLNFASGSVVEKGQVLLEIDHQTEQAQLDGALARRTLAKQRLARLNTLFAKQQVSQEQIDAATAELDLAQSDIDVLTVTIGKKVLRAPISGQVGLHQFQEGQYLDGNSHITTVINDTHYAQVDFQVPQSYPLLAEGTEVTVNLVGTERAYDAKISAISPELSDARSVRYRATLSEQTPLKPNALVSLVVPVSERYQVVRVPNVAVSRDQFGTFVYAIESDDQQNLRAIRKEVVAQSTDANQVIITQGLEADTLIATKGAFKLWPNVKVSTQQSASASVGG